MFTKKSSWLMCPFLWILKPFRSLWARAHMSQIKDRYYNSVTMNWEVPSVDAYRFLSDVCYLFELIGRNEKFNWDELKIIDRNIFTHFGDFDNYVRWVGILTSGIEEACSVGNTVEAARFRTEVRGKGKVDPISCKVYFRSTYDIKANFGSYYQGLKILLIRSEIIADKEMLDPDDTIMDREVKHIFPDVIGILEAIEGVLDGKTRKD